MIVNCTTCNREFNRRPSYIRERNFCSKKCFLDTHYTERQIVNCDYCGKQLKRRPDQINPKNFCNKKCMHNNAAKNSKNCYSCNKEITSKRARTAYCKGFCSDNCVIDYALDTYGKDHGLTFREYTCKQCNDIFYTFEKNRIFCSIPCRAEYYGKEKHHMWVEDRSKVNNPDPDRCTKEYKAWKKYIFKRDNHTCQICGIGRDKDILNAHHIKKFSVYKDLRTDTENGITLCEHNCHIKTYHYEELFEDLFSEMVDLINRGELKDKREYYKNVFLTIVKNKHEI